MSRYVGFRHLLATIGQYIYIYLYNICIEWRSQLTSSSWMQYFFLVLISSSPLQFNDGAVKMAALCVPGVVYWSCSHHIQNTRTRWCTRGGGSTNSYWDFSTVHRAHILVIEAFPYASPHRVGSPIRLASKISSVYPPPPVC